MLTTVHRLIAAGADSMPFVDDESIATVVTSPPYPMIQMWDESFADADPEITGLLEAGRGHEAFEHMHCILDRVWRECARIVIPGGIVCINIGDATRTLDGEFALYTNQQRITKSFEKLGFRSLPAVIWRKPTNAPNKFMGSGMLPGAAYVTLEHEYILVFRKGPKRAFSAADRARRRSSAYFWEERNRWFSDLWEIVGTRQKIDTAESRLRSAAFPFEIPFRLIAMHSIKGDTVLDPFSGTGTTTLAAAALARNSVAVEIDGRLVSDAAGRLVGSAPALNQINRERVRRHRQFVTERLAGGGALAHEHRAYGFPVMTSQETDMSFETITSIDMIDEGDECRRVTVAYEPLPETTR